MKIAFLSFYSGLIDRGVESWTHELANRLSSMGHEVTVYQAGPAKKDADYKVVEIPIAVDWDERDYRGSILRRLFLDYWSLLIARFTLKSAPALLGQKFDIVMPTNGGWQVGIVRIVSKVRGIKMVVVGHSGPGWDERNNLWSFPDVFVSLTKENKRWAKRVNPFVRVVHIPNGVNLTTFAPKGKSARINLKKPVVLIVSSAEKGKRIDLAIRAISKTNASLLILGAGPEEEKIKALGRKLLKRRFLMKRVTFEETPNFYRAADIFTLPSWAHEAFGMVYLEAMASGLPVVATKDPAREQIINGAGILVDPTDIGAYAKAIEKTLATDWGNKPRKQAEKFSWDKIAKQYEELFSDLVK